MYASHLHPRRTLTALIAAGLAALAIAIPVRLAGDLSLGSGGSGAAPVSDTSHIAPAKPQWIHHPLASPLSELQAPTAK